VTAVSVIIPAHNASTTLGACLDGLAREHIPGSAGELIVVDDASTDDTRQIATRPGVRVLSGPGTGPSAARNTGARAAEGEVLVFLDADTVPQPGWLREMIAPLQDPQIVAVKGRYRTDQRTIMARFAQLEFEWKYARLERATRVDFVDTGTAAYRRDLFLTTGGFDEQLRSGEDVDLAFRLASQGAQFAFNPRAVVQHHHTEDLLGYFVKKAKYAGVRVELYRRYPNKAFGDSYTPPTMGLQIGLAGFLTASTAARVVGLPGTRWLSWPHHLGWIAFGVTTLPLVRRALRSDAGLAPLVPALVFIRAFAQGIGLTGSLLRRIAAQRGKRS
jgi:glycosyltransferase involved in cell wall biosynthesis